MTQSKPVLEQGLQPVMKDTASKPEEIAVDIVEAIDDYIDDVILTLDGFVKTIQAGDNVSVDSTDPVNPIVGVTGIVSFPGFDTLFNDYGFTDNSTDWDLAHSHITEDGSSHTFINQDVKTTASPTFNNITANGEIIMAHNGESSGKPFRMAIADGATQHGNFRQDMRWMGGNPALHKYWIDVTAKRWREGWWNGSEYNYIKAIAAGINIESGLVVDGDISANNIKMLENKTIVSTVSSGSEDTRARTVENLASFNYRLITATGCIIFTAPTNATTIMFNLEITGMIYIDGAGFKMNVQGYRSSTTFSNMSKTNQGVADIPVRWALDSAGKISIILGNTDTVWSHPHIAITKALISFGTESDIDDISKDWTTSIKTSFAGYTDITDPIPLSTMKTGSLDVTGDVDVSGDLEVVGTLSKGSGSFKIDHPLKPETHHLVHSFTESPQADLIYSGMIFLKNGKAEINIDTHTGMMEGTFKRLCRNIRRQTSNESGFTNIRSRFENNILYIEAEKDCSDEIFWMVIGERQDENIHRSSMTDENGRVIVEPEKINLKDNKLSEIVDAEYISEVE